MYTCIGYLYEKKNPHSIDSKRAEKMPVQMTYRNLLMFHKCFMHCDILIYSYSSVSISQCNFGNKLIANFLFVDLWCNLHFSYASSNTICSALGIDTNQYGSFHFNHSHNETRWYTLRTLYLYWFMEPLQ